MNEYIKQRLLTTLRILIFLGCVALVMIGQDEVSYRNLAIMGLGLAGMLAIIWDYNRRNR